MNTAFAERILAQNDLGRSDAPFITLAVPHYKQRQYLERVLESMFAQTFENYEILISDDYSPDDSNAVIPGFLQASGKAFRYYAQPKNLGYDGNVRFCLAAARGRFVMFFGNDDAMGGPTCLQELVDELRRLNFPAVAFTDYQDWQSHARAGRTHVSRVMGRGPDMAVACFRTFSFVGGLIYDRELAARFDTSKWDKSVYYQIYLAAKIIANGGAVASIDVIAVSKDVRIDSKTVPNVPTKLANARWSFASRHSGMDNVIRVTTDAILPEVPDNRKSTYARRIVSQILSITYGYWLIEYRRLGNWSSGVGLARGMWPELYLKDVAALTWLDRAYIWCLYFAMTIAGLTMPMPLFGAVKRLGVRLRRRQQEATLSPVA